MMQAPLVTSELHDEQAQASSTPTLLPTTMVQIYSYISAPSSLNLVKLAMKVLSLL
jgi:hypothetical protein